MYGRIPLHGAATPVAAVPASSTGTDWIEVIQVIGAVAAAVSALAVIVGGIYWLLKRHARAEREAREEQVSANVADMEDRIEHIQRVVVALAEEQQGRRPQPRVAFRLGDGPARAIGVRKASLPPVDVEAIVKAERAAALATMLPIEDTGEIATASTHNVLGAMAQAARALALVGSPELSVTNEDHERFKERVDDYETELRKFIAKWINFFDLRRRVVVLTAHIDNDGGAPAEAARVRLRFPDPCGPAEWAEKPERPKRPKFARRRNAAFGGTRIPSSLLTSFDPPRIEPQMPNLTGPFYEEGSLVVRFEYPAGIPHHDSFETDPFLVGVPEPGTFEIETTIGAKNLALPERGELTLEVQHEPAAPEPITTLDALLAVGGSRD